MGCGAWIKVSQRERFHIVWNGGWGTNTLVELMALWCGLIVAHNLKLQKLSIYGDSKMIIDTFLGNCPNSSISSHGWFKRANFLLEKLEYPPLHHIYHELNTRADSLSKQGLKRAFGSLLVSHLVNNATIWKKEFPIPWYRGLCHPFCKRACLFEAFLYFLHYTTSLFLSSKPGLSSEPIYEASHIVFLQGSETLTSMLHPYSKRARLTKSDRKSVV